HYGYSREEFLAMTIKDIRPPEDVPALLDTVARHSGGIDNVGNWRHVKKDGRIINVEITSHKLTFAGRPAQLVLVNDITERMRAELALRDAEEKYRNIFENAVEGIYQASPDGRFISVNPALARILGYESPEELMKHRLKVAGEHYVERDCYLELERLLGEYGVVVGYECEVYRKDRRRIWTSENVRVIRNRKGAIDYYEGSIEDISERKGLEEQLRQAQKMEAIGRLAGGVAHDFNNMLAIIMMHSDLTLRTLKPEDPLFHRFDEIKKAGERASSLTRQLLAFSRKQVQKLRVINLNTIIVDMEKMLRRLIGEDIELRTTLREGLGSVKADPGQIEQVVMNLVVNARDAMPEGGKLTIETENVFLDEAYASTRISVEAGYYVMLAVSDTGAGMDRRTQERIFDPFFTTKEVGRGTGLGLSTVYGIIKQTGGNIWVYSEIGRGTTFKIYLPRVDERAEQIPRSGGIREMAKGTETILLAEDEGLVRNLAREVLEVHGYKVLEAANGGAAFLICERFKGTIHLLLTDVIMPEMSGGELAKRLALIRPEMRVLFMSGYTDNAIVHHGVLDEGMNFIQKPFSADALAQKVREVLDAPK
ncbi:MAG: PAS domain S-box protein, partial [Acidobacteriota bacterium]|nr:PAS domain S-box protein [Acidobacteriota bacterium]